MSFSQLLAMPDISERYRKVKRYFYLRESAYDVSSKCQLRCEGCYYFQGDKFKTKDVISPEVWENFFAAERDRGITYAVLAGAEPSLAPDVLSACSKSISLGTIASNGLRRVDPNIRYRIHLSVWGDAEGDKEVRRTAGGRPGPNFLDIQLRNYRNDERVVFVYTFNGRNTAEVDDVARQIGMEGHKLTFNIFSPPKSYAGGALGSEEIRYIRLKMHEMLERYPEVVLYSHYNALVHTSEESLDTQFGCVYPRAASRRGESLSGISHTFRSYRTDLTHALESDCCVPDTDCASCRHYAAGSAIVAAKMKIHSRSEESFRAWLDYVDIYLSVWVLGYEKSPPLYAGELRDRH